MAADDKMVLEFVAKVDASIKNAFANMAEMIKALNGSTAKLTDAVTQMASGNRKASAALNSTTDSAKATTRATNDLTAATKKHQQVSDNYLKQYQRITQAHKENTAERGNALRALGKTEVAYRKEAASIKMQQSAIDQLKDKIAELNTARQYQTTKRGDSTYAKKIAEAQTQLQGLQSGLQSSVNEINKSFDYTGKYADNLKLVQREFAGVNKSMGAFRKEAEGVQRISSKIASTTVEGSSAQKAEYNALNRMVADYSKENSRLSAAIKEKNTAAATASATEKGAIAASTNALRLQKQALTEGFTKNPEQYFSAWKSGLIGIERKYSDIVLRTKEAQTAFQDIMGQRRGGLISNAETNRQISDIIKADRDMERFAKLRVEKEEAAAVKQAAQQSARRQKELEAQWKQIRTQEIAQRTSFEKGLALENKRIAIKEQKEKAASARMALLNAKEEGRATSRFKNETAEVQKLAKAIASSSPAGSFAQTSDLAALERVLSRAAMGLTSVRGKIGETETALKSTTGAARDAAVARIAAYKQEEAALQKILANPTEALAKYNAGVSEIGKHYDNLVVKGAKYEDMLAKIRKEEEAGNITRKDAKFQTDTVVAASKAHAKLKGEVSLAGKSITDFNKTVSEQALVTSAANGTLAKSTKLMREQAGLARTARTDFSFFGDVTQSLRSMASYAIAGGAVYGIIGTFANAAATVRDYNQSLKDLQAITMSSDDDIALLGSTILAVTKKYKFGLSEVAEAAKIIGQAGYSASQTMMVLDSTMMLAQGTMSSIKDSADLITTALAAFQQEGLTAADAADTLAQAVNKSKLDIEKLRTVFNYVGPVANDAGVSFKETAAALMVLANQGMRASTIGTSLRNIFARLESPSGKLKKALEGTAGALEAIKDKNTSLVEKFTILGGALGDSANLYELFGLRAAGAVSILMRFPGEVERMQNSLYVMGVAGEMADKQMEGLGNKIENLKARLQVLAVSAGEDAGKGFGMLVDALAAVVAGMTKLSETGAGKVLVAVVGTTAVVTALWAATVLLTKGWVSLNAAMVTSIPALTAYTGAATTATGATTRLGAAMGLLARNPLLMVFTAIAAIVGTATLALSANTDAVGDARRASAELIKTKQEEYDLATRAATANSKIKENEQGEYDRMRLRMSVSDKMPQLRAALSEAKTQAETQAILDKFKNDTAAELTDALVARLQTEQTRLAELRTKLLTQQGNYTKAAGTRTAENVAPGPNPYDVFSDELGDSSPTLSDMTKGIDKTSKEIGDAMGNIQQVVDSKSRMVATSIRHMTGDEYLQEFAQQMNAFAANFTGNANKVVQEAIKSSIEIQEAYSNLSKGKVDTSFVESAFARATEEVQVHLDRMFDSLPDKSKLAFTKMVANYEASLKSLEKLSGGERELAEAEAAKKLYAQLYTLAEDNQKHDIALLRAQQQRDLDNATKVATSKEDLKKREGEIIARYAKQEEEIVDNAAMHLLQWLAAIDGIQLEPKVLQLIIQGNMQEAANLNPAVSGFVDNNKEAIVRSMVALQAAQEAARKGEGKAKFGGTSGSSKFANEERKRIDALKAQLDAEQAVEELAYEKGERSLQAYSTNRLDIEERMLSAREEMVARMAAKARSAEDRAYVEKEQQTLAKDRAQFEVKYIKETRDANFKAIEQRVAMNQMMSDRGIALIDKNHTHYLRVIDIEHQATMSGLQDELAGLEEKGKMQMSMEERLKLEGEVYKTNTDLLREQVDYKERIREASARNMEYEYRLGIRATSEYAEYLQQEGTSGRMGDYQAYDARMQATGGIVDLLGVSFRNAKAESLSFGETVVSMADRMNQGLMSASDSFVDAWVDGTKSVGDAMKQLASDVLKDMAKIGMRSVMSNLFYGGVGGGGVGAGGGLGGLFGGILGMFGGGAPAVGKNASTGDAGADLTAQAAEQMARDSAEQLAAIKFDSSAQTSAVLQGANAQVGIAAQESATSGNIFSAMGSGILSIVSGIGNGVFNIITSIFSGGTSGGSGFLSGIFGFASKALGFFVGGGGAAGGTGIGTPGYSGGASGGAGLIPPGSFFPKLHTGGRVGSTALSRVFLPNAVFEGAARYHSGGTVMGRDEVPAILRKGEVVQTPEQAANSGKVEINQNIEFTIGKGATDEGNLKPEAMKEMSRQIKQATNAAFTEYVNNQSRSGGLLSKGISR